MEAACTVHTLYVERTNFISSNKTHPNKIFLQYILSLLLTLYAWFIIRMEDQEEEWEYEEYYNFSKEDLRESNLSWLLRKGLSLGNKAVITGVIISSAPLVLPPLVVVSALGFVVLVPAGVVLASYACTEKLMNKLLPIPALSFIMLEEEGDGVVGHFEVVGKGEKVIVSIQPCVDIIKDIEQNDVTPIETYNHAEKSRQEDEKELPKGVVVSKEAEKNIGNAGEVKILDVTKIHDDGISHETLKKKRNYKKKISMSCLKMSHGVGEKEEYILVKSKKETGKKNLKVDTTAKVENLVPTVEMKSFFPHITANEVFPSEKKLWDKVDALRLIVGYKAARRQSLSEELWGLYVFTGVKPPSSFENSIEDKLHFLMSIIGVK